MTQRVTIVEVGMRDGFQSIAQVIPTDIKISILSALHQAGVRRIEATSFVSTKAVPQLADATRILMAAQALPGLDPQVLTPTARYTEQALAAGARHVAFVLSVSERHNVSNVRRTPAESMEEFKQIITMLPGGARLRVNVATAFDCPYGGLVDAASTLAIIEQLIANAPHAEIALCDTTGRATPRQVGQVFALARAEFPAYDRWTFHAHDTYGMGAANVMAAWNSGVRTMDASIAGLGGCPFAPGATGNVATEDLVWMFEGSHVSTGIALTPLLEVARRITALPGAQVGGRVREALHAKSCKQDAAAS